MIVYDVQIESVDWRLGAAKGKLLRHHRTIRKMAGAQINWPCQWVWCLLLLCLETTPVHGARCCAVCQCVTSMHLPALMSFKHHWNSQLADIGSNTSFGISHLWHRGSFTAHGYPFAVFASSSRQQQRKRNVQMHCGAFVDLETEHWKEPIAVQHGDDAPLFGLIMIFALLISLLCQAAFFCVILNITSHTINRKNKEPAHTKKWTIWQKNETDSKRSTSWLATYRRCFIMTFLSPLFFLRVRAWFVWLLWVSMYPPFINNNRTKQITWDSFMRCEMKFKKNRNYEALRISTSQKNIADLYLEKGKKKNETKLLSTEHSFTGYGC